MSLLTSSPGQGFKYIDGTTIDQIGNSWSPATKIEEIVYNTAQNPNNPIQIALPAQSLSGTPITASWSVVTSEAGILLHATPMSGSWRVVTPSFITTVNATPMSGSWRVVTASIAGTGTVTLLATPMSGGWQVVTAAIAASGTVNLTATPMSGNWRVVTPSFIQTILVTPVSGNWSVVNARLITALSATPASATWVVVTADLAPSGHATISSTPITAPWTANTFSALPYMFPQNIGADWRVAKAKINAVPNFTVSDVPVTTANGDVNLGNIPGFIPSFGIYWQQLPDEAWHFVAVTGTVFHIPVTGGVNIRYTSKPFLEERGQIGESPWNRLPSWMRPHFDPTSPTRGLFKPIAFQGSLINQFATRIGLQQWLQLVPVNADRWLWVGAVPNLRQQDLSISFHSDDGSDGVARRAISTFDFSTANDPVWYTDILSSRVLLRNLMVVELVVFSSSNVYTIYGEASGLVEDWGIWWRTSTDLPWQWLDPETGAISGNIFTLPVSGSAVIRYASKSRLVGLDGSIIIRWLGGQTKSFQLTLTTPANIFDSYGDLIGVPRITGEDNITYKTRLGIFLASPSDTTLTGVIRGISSQLGLVTIKYWDGVSTLTLDASGTSGITQVSVVGVPSIREITEQLTPDTLDFSTFHSSFGNWREGAFVTEDGRAVPVVAVSGNVITLARPASGTVVATYSFTQYSFTTDSSGFVRSILPGTGVPSGSYVLVVSKLVKAYTPDLPNIQSDKLLDSRGIPNRLFLDLVTSLTTENPTTFGRARWGQAYWSTQSEVQPPISRLPVPLDITSIIECADQTLFGVIPTLMATPIHAGWSVPVATLASSSIDQNNLFLWFKADSITGLVNGQSISLWHDSGPNAQDLEQTTVAEQFVYHTNVQNGLPGASGANDGTDGTFMSFVNFPVAKPRYPTTFYMVISQNADQGTGTQHDAPIWDISGDTFNANGSDTFFIMGDASGQFTYEVDTAWSVYPPVWASGVTAVTGTQILALVVDDTNSQIRLYRNGALLKTNAYTPVSHTDDYLAVGINNATGNAFEGYFFELLVYSAAHNDAQVLANTNALNTKWAIF